MAAANKQRWIERINGIVGHLQRLFPLDNTGRYKDSGTLGIHRFLKQIFLTDPHGRYNEGSGNIDPKAFGTVFHGQIAGWTNWTPSPSVPTYEAFLATCTPQVRQLITYFGEKGYVGIASNRVIADPALNYSTPVDILMVPTTGSSEIDFVLLVELKTTHTLFRPGHVRFLYPLSEYMAFETPEAFASLQAALPAIRMNEVIGADPILKAEKRKIIVLPLVVMVRMNNTQTITKIEEHVVPLPIQKVAFRDLLAATLPALRRATENYRVKNAGNKFIRRGIKKKK